MLHASYMGRHRRLSPQRKMVAAGVTGAAFAAGIVGFAGPASAASQSDWEALAQCESNGNWHMKPDDGFSGGLQFTESTWEAYGGTEYASRAYQASKEAQIAVAKRVLAAQGQDAWPACSEEVSLSGGNANAEPASTDGSASDSGESGSAETSSSGSASSGSESSGSESSGSEGQSTEGSSGSGQSYVVKSGDTLTEIGDEFGVGWQSIYEANQDVISDPTMIYPDQELTIPAA